MKSFIWLCLASVACSSPPTRSTAATPSAPVTPNTTKQTPRPVADKTLPPGVLADAPGKQGRIRVVEKNGLRMLTIAGAVQGAIRTDRAARVGGDPIVKLMQVVRPRAKRVLLIGLGTGRTATDFANAGMKVDAVELEPKVIEFARAHFGFTGNAIAGDGATYIKTTKQRYDLVVVDAFNGKRLPRTLVSAAAIRDMVGIGSSDAVIAVRMVGSPRDTQVQRLWQSLRHTRPMMFPEMFGTGLGDERQTMFALTSTKPLNFVNTSGLIPWPVQMSKSATVAPAWAAKSHSQAPTRELDLVGYIVKLADGSLALDLPHWEMGAIRFLLTGTKAATLAALIPAGATFPTAGDIRSDGNTRHTLHTVFGGGGGKRSEVRFSPVVAALKGKAKLKSVVHVNAALGVPARFRKGAANDKRLPYGGALYELAVSDVHWSFTYEQWRDMQRKARPHIAKAIRYINQGKLRRATKETKGYLYAFERRFKRHAQLIHSYRMLNRRFKKLSDHAFKVPRKATPFQLARACDRAAIDRVISLDGSATAAMRLTGALRNCARTNYARTLKRDKQNSDTAVRRLLSLYDVMDFEVGKFKARVYKRKLNRLRKRFPRKQALTTPP